MDLPKLLALVKARAGLLIAVTLIAAGLALVVSLSQDERYRATAVLLFGGGPNAETLVEGTSDADAEPEQSTATNVALASLDSVVPRVKQRLRTTATLGRARGRRGDRGAGPLEPRRSSPRNGARRTVRPAWRTTFAEEVVAQRREIAQAETQKAIDALNQAIAAQPTARRRSRRSGCGSPS